MRIENLRLEKTEYGRKSVATVTWENSDRSPMDMYFGTTLEFADALSCNANAFMSAATIAALGHGEERVSIEGKICPYLRLGLETAIAWLQHWYGYEKIPRIEVEVQETVEKDHSGEKRAGMFFSGGIDALATLRRNRLNFPPEHPGAIKDGVVVFGLEIDKEESYNILLDSMKDVALDARMNIMPVYTNVRYLDDSWRFWSDQFESSCFASIAHAFSTRFNIIYLASSFDIPKLHPHGSHPDLDPNYSSYDLRIIHDDIVSSRFEKTRFISDWEAAIRNVRVCNETQNFQKGQLNCGKCEKCIRSMLSFLALGVLDKTNAFPAKDVTPDLVATIRMTHVNHFFYAELLDPLKKQGRQDLVDAIQQKLKHHYGEDFKGRLKSIDKQYLGSSLTKLKKLVAG